jgi:hypothetical protein
MLPEQLVREAFAGTVDEATRAGIRALLVPEPSSPGRRPVR